MCPLVTLAIPQIEGNRVKAIAILTKDRSPILPNLASAHDQGLTNFDSAAWFGLFLPELNYFGTVRGRLGFTWANTLVYATGGLAYAEVEQF